MQDAHTRRVRCDEATWFLSFCRCIPSSRPRTLRDEVDHAALHRCAQVACTTMPPLPPPFHPACVLIFLTHTHMNKGLRSLNT